MTSPATPPTAPSPRPSSPTFLRPLLAFLGGLGITVVVIVIGTVVATLAMLQGRDLQGFMVSPGYLTAKLVISVLGAAAGGFTTSRFTAGRSLYTVGLLALVLFMSAMVPVLRGAAELIGQPTWYPVALALAAPLGVIAGALLERRGRRADLTAI